MLLFLVRVLHFLVYKLRLLFFCTFCQCVLYNSATYIRRKVMRHHVPSFAMPSNYVSKQNGCLKEEKLHRGIMKCYLMGRIAVSAPPIWMWWWLEARAFAASNQAIFLKFHFRHHNQFALRASCIVPHQNVACEAKEL